MSNNVETKAETINTDDLMAEFDRESNTRRFTGVAGLIMKVLFIAFLYNNFNMICRCLPS